MDESDYLGELSQSHADLEAVPSMLLLSLESSLDEVQYKSIQYNTVPCITEHALSAIASAVIFVFYRVINIYRLVVAIVL